MAIYLITHKHTHRIFGFRQIIKRLYSLKASTNILRYQTADKFSDCNKLDKDPRRKRSIHVSDKNHLHRVITIVLNEELWGDLVCGADGAEVNSLRASRRRNYLRHLPPGRSGSAFFIVLCFYDRSIWRGFNYNTIPELVIKC